jgi:hypothetical protein
MGRLVLPNIAIWFPLAFSKTAHLDLVAAFNLFNRANVAQINPVFGAGAIAQAGFLQPIAGAGSRRIQFRWILNSRWSTAS